MIYISESHCPYINLAYENLLMQNLDRKDFFLYFYTNRPSIVFGRFQNPWLECDLELMKKHSVACVRRQSGGGCVYHDLGNLNVSFIANKSIYNKELHYSFILKVLSEFGIILNDRFDLQLKKDDQFFKVSGSASKEKKDRAIHHLTLLFNTDLDMLNKYLKVKPLSIETKSTRSVRSRVANLSNYIKKKEFIDKLSCIVLDYFKSNSQIIKLSDEMILSNISSDANSLAFYNKIKSDDWIFDETPKFTLKTKSASFIINKSYITDFETNLSLHPSFLNEINLILKTRTLKFYDFIKMISSINGADIYDSEIEILAKDLKQSLYFSLKS